MKRFEICRVMVLSLLVNDARHGSKGVLVQILELMQLLFEMPENHALDSDRRSRNGRSAKKAGKEAEHVSTQATKMVAATAPHPGILEVAEESRPVTFLVGLELAQEGDKIRHREAADQRLGAIDVYRTMLPGVVDLDDAPGQARVNGCLGDCVHSVLI